jgi:hypothetical protein
MVVEIRLFRRCLFIETKNKYLCDHHLLTKTKNSTKKTQIYYVKLVSAIEIVSKYMHAIIYF